MSSQSVRKACCEVEAEMCFVSSEPCQDDGSQCVLLDGIQHRARRRRGARHLTGEGTVTTFTNGSVCRAVAALKTNRFLLRNEACFCFLFLVHCTKSAEHFVASHFWNIVLLFLVSPGFVRCAKGSSRRTEAVR